MLGSRLKPMLASPVEDTAKLRYPLYASPKLDGVRAIVLGGVVLSRTLKPIPNAHVQKLFGRPEFEGYDGELIVGPANAANCYNVTVSAVMKQTGWPDAKFHVFDSVKHPEEPYTFRWGVDVVPDPRIVLVGQVRIESEEDLLNYERKMLEYGYEGVMIRDPEGYYKFGRSTVREQWLLKLKRFEEEEAVIYGYEERMTNLNEQTEDALGNKVRSSAAGGLVPAGTLGVLLCNDMRGKPIRVSPGTLTAAQRQHVWDNQAWYLGRIIKYKHFLVGAKDAPRFPTCQGFRDPLDM